VAVTRSWRSDQHKCVGKVSVTLAVTLQGRPAPPTPEAVGVLEEARVTFLATTSRQVLPRAASWPGKLNQSVNQDQAVRRAALATRRPMYQRAIRSLYTSIDSLDKPARRGNRASGGASQGGEIDDRPGRLQSGPTGRDHVHELLRRRETRP